MQNRSQGAKHASPVLHTRGRANQEQFQQSYDLLLSKNPALKDFIRPDYQHNYFDPPYDITTQHFLEDLKKTWPWQRQRLLKRYLPKELYKYKAFVSKLPIAQLQQIREHIYISRIGNLGTNSPCDYTRRHWIHRLTSSDTPIEADILQHLTLAERIRWYETAIQNLTVDAAEEEYLRYRFCNHNRMPLVQEASIHNQAHYNPSKNLVLPHQVIPPQACRSLMHLIHDAHRYFANWIQRDCSHYYPAFYKALVNDLDLNQTLLEYDKIQRCALGREIRARLLTKPPTLAPAWQIFNKTIITEFLPRLVINAVEIRDNPVVKFEEVDNTDTLPLFEGANIPKLKPLVDEIRNDLIAQGLLEPLPFTTMDHQQQQQQRGGLDSSVHHMPILRDYTPPKTTDYAQIATELRQKQFDEMTRDTIISPNLPGVTTKQLTIDDLKNTNENNNNTNNFNGSSLTTRTSADLILDQMKLAEIFESKYVQTDPNTGVSTAQIRNGFLDTLLTGNNNQKYHNQNNNASFVDLGVSPAQTSSSSSSSSLPGQDQDQQQDQQSRPNWVQRVATNRVDPNQIPPNLSGHDPEQLRRANIQYQRPDYRELDKQLEANNKKEQEQGYLGTLKSLLWL